MSSNLPAPMVPAEVDLRDFPFMPLDIIRLFGSRFHAIATDAEWRAGVTLWAKSFHQVPAASVPDDDVELCRLAELGRDVKAWRKVREVALHGWVKCSDGRWYHPVVAEKANEAWTRKQAQRARSAKGNAARWGHRDPSPDELAAIQGSSEERRGDAQGMPEAIPQGSLKDSRKDPKGQGQGQGNTETPSVPDGTAAKAAPVQSDAADVIWANGLAMLTAAAVPEHRARAFLGRLRSCNADDAIAEAIARCAKQTALDPVTYLQGCLRITKAKARAHSGFADKDYTHGVTDDGFIEA